MFSYSLFRNLRSSIDQGRGNDDIIGQSRVPLKVCRCYGGCVEMLWRLCRDVMEVVSRCYGGCVEMLWRLCLDVMEVVSRCYGGCVEMLWRLCLDVMEVVSRCYGGCV